MNLQLTVFPFGATILAGGDLFDRILFYICGFLLEYNKEVFVVWLVSVCNTYLPRMNPGIG